jgi:AcrR family transcriptional regulator
MTGAAGPPRRPLGPRDRMVRSAAQLIRRKGVSGTGMREVVAHAESPRGSLQHYFPGGKDQLVGEALLWIGGVAGRQVGRVLESLSAPSPGELFAGIVATWRTQFLSEGFDAGCPLIAAAADVAATSDELRGVISRAFEGWQEPLAAALRETGVPEERATALAIVMISALEGAIVLARIRQDVGPLDVIVDELAPLLDAAVPARRRRGHNAEAARWRR